MLKKLLFVAGLFSALLIAQPTTSQMVSAVKKNPSLLNTPEAQAELQKRGLSKTDVINKLKESKNLDKNKNIKKILIKH